MLPTSPNRKTRWPPRAGYLKSGRIMYVPLPQARSRRLTMIDSIATYEAILKSHNPPERPKKTQDPVTNAINESNWTKQKDTLDASHGWNSAQSTSMKHNSSRTTMASSTALCGSFKQTASGLCLGTSPFGPGKRVSCSLQTSAYAWSVQSSQDRFQSARETWPLEDAKHPERSHEFTGAPQPRV